MDHEKLDETTREGKNRLLVLAQLDGNSAKADDEETRFFLYEKKR